MARPRKYATDEERTAALKAYHKQWYEKNKDRIKEYQKSIKDKLAKAQQLWKIKNREAYRAYQKAYRAKRLKEDPEFKQRCNQHYKTYVERKKQVESQDQ